MSITVSTLANGLRVATDSMSGVETVSLGVWVGVGTRHESDALNGISHLLEHMAFKGTSNRSAARISEEIENVGGQINAHTAREHTAYYAKVLKEDCPLALDVVADILQRPLFDADDLEREKAVVLQEISQTEDVPDDVVFDYFQEAAYPGQAMGRSILGTARNVRDISTEQLRAFMKRTYTASTMIVAAAGQVEHEAFLRLAETMFADLPAGDAPQSEPALYRGGVRQQSRDLEQVHIVLGFDGVAYDHPLYYANAVFSTVLGGGTSSRLFQEIREKRGLAYSVYSYASSCLDAGLFGVYAGTVPTEAEEVLSLIGKETLRASEGIVDDELKRARAQLRSSILMGLESSSNRCEQLARNLQIYGRAVSTEEILEKIEAVDGKAVREAAFLMLQSAATIVTLGDVGHMDLSKIQGKLRG